MDPHKILGISKDASPDEIKKAYRAAAKKHHPDRGGEVWIFQQVQAAYNALTNPTAKKKKKPAKKPAQKKPETSSQSKSKPKPKAEPRSKGKSQSKEKRKTGPSDFHVDFSPEAEPRTRHADKEDFQVEEPAGKPKRGKNTKPSQAIFYTLISLGCILTLAIAVPFIFFLFSGEPQDNLPNKTLQIAVLRPEEAKRVKARRPDKSSTIATPLPEKHVSPRSKSQAEEKPVEFLELVLDESVEGIAFSPDGKHIISASTEGNLLLWDAVSGKRMKDFRQILAGSTAIKYSPNGKFLVRGTKTGKVEIRDLAAGMKLHRSLAATLRSSPITSVDVSNDGLAIVSSSILEDKVMRWSMSTAKHRWRTIRGGPIARAGRCYGLAFSPDSKLIVTGNSNKTVMTWTSDKGKQLATLRGHSGKVLSVAFSPDSNRIVSGSADGTIKLWDVTSGRELNTLNGHTDWVKSVSFSPDGTLIASGSRDHSVKVWDADTGKELQTFNGHTDSVESIAFSPDGKRIASGSYDRTVRIWSLSE